MIDRAELKEKVPFGYQKIIAERAGVTSTCVCAFLAGKTNNAKVELATLEVIAEISNKKKELLKQIM